MSACPACCGSRIVADPSGFRWSHRPSPECGIRVAEDATRNADVLRVPLLGETFTRPATPAERLLLAACGVTLPEVAFTTVDFARYSQSFRSWPGVRLDPAVSP